MSGDEVVVTLDLRDPPPEVMEYARLQLGESPDTKLRAVQELRDIIYERGEVRPHRTDDSFLLRFLRARHFVVEKAHRLMERYYHFKAVHPDYVTDVNPMRLEYLATDAVIVVLPYREQAGRRVLIYRLGRWDPHKYPVEEILKATLVVLELAVLEQQAQVMGGVCVFDLRGLTLQHVLNVTPAVARQVVDLMGASFPIRTHAIHIVNQPWVFDMLFAIFKPLLDEKVRERVHIHGNSLESLHQHIDPKYLPECYGGVCADYSCVDWMWALNGMEEVRAEIRSLGYVLEPVEGEEDT